MTKNVAIPASDQVFAIGAPMLEGLVEKSPVFFDPYLKTSNPVVQGFIAGALADSERLFPRKQRARRPADQRVLEALVAAVYANLAAVVASGAEPRTVAVGLAKPTKKLGMYGTKDVGQLPSVLQAMANAGLLVLAISRKYHTASSIAPSADFVEALATTDIGWHQFRQREGGQTVYLSTTERDFAAGTRSTTLIEYEDTEETIRFRAEMAEINAALRGADIGFVPDGEPQPRTHERQLRRIFNLPRMALDADASRFRFGGRLYGGWWESMPRLRRHNIRIEGSPIADLDYSAMFLRLAYLRTGHPPPDGNLYSGILPDDPDGKYRDGVKQVVNAMLARSTPMTKLPIDARRILPDHFNGRMMSEAVRRRHPLLKDLFETGIALSLMRTESDILVRVLLELSRSGVTALCMHDGLMVHPRHAELCELVMGTVSERVVGMKLPVKVALSV